MVNEIDNPRRAKWEQADLYATQAYDTSFSAESKKIYLTRGEN